MWTLIFTLMIVGADRPLRTDSFAISGFVDAQRCDAAALAHTRRLRAFDRRGEIRDVVVTCVLAQ